jgi:hypothetical protein
MAIQINNTTVIDDSRNIQNISDASITGNSVVGGALTVTGNLTVNGTQTIINTQILDVADKTIGVGSTSTKTALTQNGAGLVIYGPIDVNFTYDMNKVAVGLNTNLSVAGVVTATSFSGNGANLTGLIIPAGFTELDAALFS